MGLTAANEDEDPPPSMMVIAPFQSALNSLLQKRIVRLGGEVNDDIANSIVAQFLYLDAMDPEEDITFYINSPGGSVTAGACCVWMGGCGRVDAPRHAWCVMFEEEACVWPRSSRESTSPGRRGVCVCVGAPRPLYLAIDSASPPWFTSAMRGLCV